MLRARGAMLLPGPNDDGSLWFRIIEGGDVGRLDEALISSHRCGNAPKIRQRGIKKASSRAPGQALECMAAPRKSSHRTAMLILNPPEPTPAQCAKWHRRPC
jgi:hypothetical protein